MQSNYTLSGDPLSLDRIRSVLTRLEDTIIFGLIERAQFTHNPKIYQKGALEELRELDFKGSWLDWFLSETEAFHGTLARYRPTGRLPSSIPLVLPVPPLVRPADLFCTLTFGSSSKGAEIYQVRTFWAFATLQWELTFRWCFTQPG